MRDERVFPAPECSSDPMPPWCGAGLGTVWKHPAATPRINPIMAVLYVLS